MTKLGDQEQSEHSEATGMTRRGSDQLCGAVLRYCDYLDLNYTSGGPSSDEEFSMS
jgi:hypothetical protein